MANTKKGMLPRQEWDEINVSHERVKEPQRTEVTVKLPKAVEKALRALGTQKGRKHGK